MWARPPTGDRRYLVGGAGLLAVYIVAAVVLAGTRERRGDPPTRPT